MIIALVICSFFYLLNLFFKKQQLSSISVVLRNDPNIERISLTSKKSVHVSYDERLNTNTIKI